MKILLLGGTGAMGIPLSRMLLENGHDVTITSRRNLNNNEGVVFVKGNALELDFVSQLMQTHYDVVVDFMVRTEKGTKAAMDIILPSCGQYIFISTSRVFAPIDIKNGERITEESPRLLDVCKDIQYVESNEYAIEKAREENLFFKSEYKNWTIVRPTLTYNTHRLQFAYGEKEDWLFRVLNGQSLVFPKDMENVKTAMVHGNDVAKVIFKLIGNKKALGVAVNVVSEEFKTWGEIFSIYKKVIEKHTGKKVNVVYVEKALDLANIIGNYYQVKYARSIDRCFSNRKLKTIIDNVEFIPMEKGLANCLDAFLEDPRFLSINWRNQACYDKICKEWTPLNFMPSRKVVFSYLCCRCRLEWILKILHGLKRMLIK